ncbi:MAG: hypothetical protein Q8867_04510 [Bacteroidota bacterium]|nr:hypothetical protein [Bacteroidota bacterium]
MFENLKKSFDKGYDFVFETRDKIEKAAKDFAQENNLTKEEAKKVLDSWIKISEEAKKKLEKQMTEFQKTAFEKMNVATKEDMKKLEVRIKKLESYHKTPMKIKPASTVQKRNVKKAE